MSLLTNYFNMPDEIALRFHVNNSMAWRLMTVLPLVILLITIVCVVVLRWTLKRAMNTGTSLLRTLDSLIPRPASGPLAKTVKPQASFYKSNPGLPIRRTFRKTTKLIARATIWLLEELLVTFVAEFVPGPRVVSLPNANSGSANARSQQPTLHGVSRPKDNRPDSTDSLLRVLRSARLRIYHARQASKVLPKPNEPNAARLHAVTEPITAKTVEDQIVSLLKPR